MRLPEQVKKAIEAEYDSWKDKLWAGKRNAEEFFREHDKNKVDNTVARDFYLSK